ncbi:MAG: hypothetical protein KC561_03540 [Myxococcales bacterium]|nr:hypothetical protein [Myxococcales bacterium]
MKSLLTLLSMAVAVLAFGCAEGDEGWADNGEGYFLDWQTYAPAQLDVRSAALRGSVGPVAGINHSASEVQAWYDSYYASVYTIVDAPQGAVMTIFEVEGGIDQLDLGQTYVFSGYDYTQDVSVQVIGCAGQAVDEWEFDQTADVVTVTVTEAPGALLVNYTAEFSPQYGDSFGSAQVPTAVEGTLVIGR